MEKLAKQVWETMTDDERSLTQLAVPAIVTDDPVSVGYAAGRLDLEVEEYPSRVDSMGLSKVIY